ncbi:MAG: DUF302 domain-containing protein [Granulosicoccus sp.]
MTLFKTTLVKTTLGAIAMTATLVACSSSDDNPVSGGESDGNFTASGLLTRSSALSVPEAIGALQVVFDGNDAVTALPPVDHQANAQSVGMTLRPTTVIFFGNPALGTPLMQANQQAGLDLPLKMLAIEGEDGSTQLAYNDPAYLQQRHELNGVDQQLMTMSAALGSFATAASGESEIALAPSSSGSVAANEGVVVVSSEQDMDTTYNALRSAIDAAAPLRIVAEVDHTANAQSAELDLLPTRLIIFGNPNLGTPLMQSGQSVAIDLPQKMLVFENETGQVSIAYNDPAYIASRHGITDQDERLTTIATALENLATNAAAAP